MTGDSTTPGASKTFKAHSPRALKSPAPGYNVQPPFRRPMLCNSGNSHKNSKEEPVNNLNPVSCCSPGSPSLTPAALWVYPEIDKCILKAEVGIRGTMAWSKGWGPQMWALRGRPWEKRVRLGLREMGGWGDGTYQGPSALPQELDSAWKEPPVVCKSTDWEWRGSPALPGMEQWDCFNKQSTLQSTGHFN